MSTPVAATRPPAGYQVKAPRRKIAVTAEDIIKAKGSNSTHCAIARALAREVEGASHISVDVATVRFTVGEERFYYHTPPAGQRFIITFDLGQNGVEPFDLVLKEGTVHTVARRPGVGGRPKGSVVTAHNRVPPRQKSIYGQSVRRTYGARSMTPQVISHVQGKAKSHA